MSSLMSGPDEEGGGQQSASARSETRQQRRGGASEMNSRTGTPKRDGDAGLGQ